MKRSEFTETQITFALRQSETRPEWKKYSGKWEFRRATFSNCQLEEKIQ